MRLTSFEQSNIHCIIQPPPYIPKSCAMFSSKGLICLVILFQSKLNDRKEILQSKDKCMFFQERKVRHILRPEEKPTCWFGGGDQDFMRTTFSSTTNPACGFYIPSSITCSHSSLPLFPIWQPVSTVTSVISLICLFLIIHTPSCSIKIDDISLIMHHHLSCNCDMACFFFFSR